MKQLELGFNEIEFLPSDIFENLAKLNILELTSNRLTQLPKIKSSRPFHLLVEANQLSILESGMFINATKLHVLNFWRNSLSILPPDLFLSAEELTDVHLGHNQIVSLQGGIFPNSIVVLFLNNNRLQTLPVNIFQGMQY